MLKAREQQLRASVAGLDNCERSVADREGALLLSSADGVGQQNNEMPRSTVPLPSSSSLANEGEPGGTGDDRETGELDRPEGFNSHLGDILYDMTVNSDFNAVNHFQNEGQATNEDGDEV